MEKFSSAHSGNLGFILTTHRAGVNNFVIINGNEYHAVVLKELFEKD